MASTNRTGRVSAIDYEAGTYEVPYFDRGKSVTRQINAMSNGEYKMPCVGQVVSVAHNSNGTAAGTTTGTIWNKTNKPAEGYKGLYRKEYGTSRKGQAYSRYDENTGVYTQYVDKRTGRTCNGEIFDEAKGPVSVIAGGQLQLKSSGASASIQAKTGMGIVAGTTGAIEAGTFMSLEATGAMSISAGGDFKFNIGGDSEEKRKGTTKQEYLDNVEQEVTGDVKQTLTGNLEQEVTGDVLQTITGTVTRNVTGDVTLNINGASITISAGGDISITSPTKVEVSAPILNAEGASGDVKVDYDGYVGWKGLSHDVEMLNGQELAELINEEMYNADPNRTDYLTALSDPAAIGEGYNMMDILKRTAFYQKHNLAVSAGSVKDSFLINDT